MAFQGNWLCRACFGRVPASGMSPSTPQFGVVSGSSLGALGQPPMGLEKS